MQVITTTSSSPPSAAPAHSWSAGIPFLDPLINSLDCGVLLIEDGAGIVVASHPLAAMFGLAVDDILRMTPDRLMDHLLKLVEYPSDNLRARKLLPADGGVVSERLEITRPFRGIVRWVARRILEPRPATLVVCSDITAASDLSSAYERLTVTDALTGLSNRRGAEQMIRREILRTRRYAAPISFVMFDIDNFQKINAAHGPGTGDQVLRQVARVMAGQLRDSDLAARWDQDEFLLTLSGTPLDNALLCAERVRKGVARMSMLMSEPVLVSGGVVQLVPGEALGDVVGRAHALVKVAKSSGRNQVR